MEQAYYTSVRRFSPAGGAQLPASHNRALNKDATRGDTAQSAPGSTKQHQWQNGCAIVGYEAGGARYSITPVVVEDGRTKGISGL